MTTEYFEAVKKVDSEIAKIVTFIDSELNEKNFLLIITADHGGSGKSHKTILREHITIPWIAYGTSIKKGYKFKNEIKIYDTAPTILYFLDIELPTGLDGRAVKEIFN